MKFDTKKDVFTCTDIQYIYCERLGSDIEKKV